MYVTAVHIKPLFHLGVLVGSWKCQILFLLAFSVTLELLCAPGVEVLPGLQIISSDARGRDQEEVFLVAWWWKSAASLVAVWEWWWTLDRAGCVTGVSWKVRARWGRTCVCAVTLGIVPGCVALSQVPETLWPFAELAIIHLFSPSK